MVSEGPRVANPVPVIEVKSLSKRFGQTVALTNINLEIYQGDAMVIGGPNGSGKSTLLKILCGIIRHPRAARVSVLGLDPWPNRHLIFRRIAASFEDYSFPDVVTGKQYLEFVAGIRGVDKDTMHDSVANLFGLESFWERPTRGYSSGMKRKVALAQLFVKAGEIILLDEPFIALDRATKLQLIEKLKEQRANGVTLVMSTHLMTDLEELVSSLIVLVNGELHKNIPMSIESAGLEEQYRSALGSA